VKTWIRIACLTLALAGTASLEGCIVTSSGANPEGTSYVFGHLDGVLKGSPQAVSKAAKNVLDDQEMKEVVEVASALDGKVTARTALDTPITITVTKKDDATSNVSIKVGSFGDHQISTELYQKIRAKLD
jgi:hypothetical protein